MGTWTFRERFYKVHPSLSLLGKDTGEAPQSKFSAKLVQLLCKKCFPSLPIKPIHADALVPDAANPAISPYEEGQSIALSFEHCLLDIPTKTNCSMQNLRQRSWWKKLVCTHSAVRPWWTRRLVLSSAGPRPYGSVWRQLPTGCANIPRWLMLSRYALQWGTKETALNPKP